MRELALLAEKRKDVVFCSFKPDGALYICMLYWEGGLLEGNTSYVQASIIDLCVCMLLLFEYVYVF